MHQRLIYSFQPKDGRKNLKHSLSLWLPSYEAIRNNKTEEMGAQAQGFDPVEVSPLLYTTRISAVKMLIELEEWDQAVQVESYEIKWNSQTSIIKKFEKRF